MRRVWLVGRRGPLQAAFTIAELRELLKLENCQTTWRVEDFEGIKEITSTLARPRKRLTELMLKSLEESHLKAESSLKEFRPVFLRSPIKFKGLNTVDGIIFSINQLEGEDLLNQYAKSTDKTEQISCGLAIRSIGYKSVQLDESVPFDSKTGRIVNDKGKVDTSLYSAGWVATGPMGVILSTMTNAFQVAKLMMNEINVDTNKSGDYELKNILAKKNVNVVDYKGWEKIDKEECERGKKLNKPREKIVNINEMLQIASK